MHDELYTHHDDCCHDEANHDDCCHDEVNHDACCHDEACHAGQHELAQLEHELKDTPTLSYHVEGIDCPHCAMTLQNAVRMLEGVDDARLIYTTATLEVVSDPAAGDIRRELLACVRSCGQDLALSEAERQELEAERPWFDEHREQVLMGISGVALLIGLVLDHLAHLETPSHVFYVVAAVAGLVFIGPMALASLRRRTADMNVLMSVAVIGALIMGFLGDTHVFADAAIVIFLDQVGEWLEGWSMRTTTGSIRELMELAPDIAHLIDAEGTRDVAVSEVEEGAHIQVLPGERVPLDGVILSGTSAFDEAAVTGESVPRDKQVGDEVFAGSLNTSAVVELEVSADEDCSTLARIISMVQGAQAQRAPYETFIDRFATAYTPIVMVGALALGLVVPAVLSAVQGPSAALWHDWVYRALSLLVVACPCALVISTPVSFVSAINRAARDGVLVKGGAALDVASHISAITLDKTGTLTTGKPSAQAVCSLNGATEEDVLRIAAALERNSTHPLARAVVAEAERRGLTPLEASGVEELRSAGMQGIIAGTTCACGKVSFVCPEGASSELAALLADPTLAGTSTLVVAGNAQVAGVIAVADTMRPHISATIDELTHTAKLRHAEMLTGDTKTVAAAVAQEAGITRWQAELLPDDKLARVRELQKRGERVAMVGDGINDAPALAQADLGITMGAASSDTALEVADVALLSDELAKLPGFFRLAAHTMLVVHENIAFAIGVKLLVFILVIAGVAGMGAAVFADTGVALLVILNGMRLMLPARPRS